VNTEHETGLTKISRELHKHSAAIDFLEELKAKQVVNAALKVIRRELNASIVELYFLSTTPALTRFLERSKYVSCFERFDWDADDDIRAKDIKRNPIYELVQENGKWTNPGVWSWVYEFKRPVWIENINEKTENGGVPNQIRGKDQDLPELSDEYSIVYPTTQCIIVVPFHHKIEHVNGTDVYGLLSVEFTDERKYSSDEFGALRSIANCFSDLRWKSKAWQENWKGTQEVTKDIIDFCNEFHDSTKTGLFAPLGLLQENLRGVVEASFAAQSIRLDFCEAGKSQSIRSHKDILAATTKSQFAIIDITKCEPTNVFLLGCMVSQGKPCLILSDPSTMEDLPSFMRWLTSSKQEETEGVIRLFAYSSGSRGDVCFSKDIRDSLYEPKQFDVFLCHSTEDKPAVKEIAKQLREQGLRPWLDEWELQPGQDWQAQLEEISQNVRSVAVFLGPSGQGPWQKMELKNFLHEYVDRGLRVIPVILQGFKDKPEVPFFLKQLTWVDFRTDADSIKRLQRSIEEEISLSWTDVWQEFISLVRRKSPLFRSAKDHSA